MKDASKRIISAATSLAGILALIIVLSIPVGYFLIEYHGLNEVMLARAETKAIFATQIISDNPDLWQFEAIRLEHFLSSQARSGEPEAQRILDLKGQVVAQTAVSLSPPIHTVSYPLYESGRVIAYLEISRSLMPFLEYSLFLGALSLLLGGVVYLILKVFPVRSLAHTLTLLNQERQRFQVIFQSNLMAVAILDRDGNILDVNPTFLHLTGMNKKELLGRNFIDQAGLKPEKEVRSLFQELLEGKRNSFHLEMAYQGRNGSPRWGDLSLFALREAPGGEISSYAMFNDITERKHAEAALEQSEAKYRALVETSFDWIWEVDVQGRYTYASARVNEILGYTPEEMLGRTPFDFMPADEARRIQATFQAIVADRQPFAALENVNLHKDGRRIVLETSGIPIFGPNGEWAGYRGTDRDITARKQAEEALAEEAIRRRILVEQSRDGIVVLDQTGKVYEANQRYAELLGYSPEEVRELYVWDWDSQWSREELLEMIRLVDAAGDHFESRHRRKDGTLIDVEISTNGAVLAEQKLVFCVVRDISLRKRAEEALRLSEAKFRELFENMSSAVAIYQGVAEGRDFIFREVNQALERIEHVKREELIGRKVDEIFPGMKAFGLFDVLQRVWRTGIPEAFPVTWYQDQRISGWKDNYVFRLPTGEVVAVYDDVTERKRAEEALSQKHRELQETAQQLEQSKNMLQLVIESIPVRVFWKDKNLRYLGCNSLFAHDAGLNQPQELLGKDDFAMGWREQADIYRADDRQVMETCRPKMNIIEPQTTPTGGKIWLNTSKVPLQMPDGEVFGVLGVYEDITARKQAEEEVIRQREELRGLSIRLAEVEEDERKLLAQELHDQICQNLATIAITLEALRIRATQETADLMQSRLSDAADLVEQTGEVAREIMEGLRPTVLEHYGLMGGLRWCAEQMVRRTGIKVAVQGEEAEPRLARTLELALFRIAQEALNNVVRHAQASRVVLAEEVDRDTVRLVIEDNGVGFDPAQTGRPEGGHRWGLMTMRERAMAVGGQCRIESQPGRGTRVIVEVNR